ncbi:Regulator of chromosome condensation, partial [Stegodyphus mimosarum]
VCFVNHTYLGNMVKRTQKSKAKSSSLKPKATAQKGTGAKKASTLSNGYPDKDLEEKHATKDKELSAEETQKSVPDEIIEPKSKAANKTYVKQSQKRKLVEETKLSVPSTSKNVSIITKSKAKRAKVLLEIPPLKTISGKVFVIGENDVGQLGLGEDIEVKKRPTVLELSQSVIDVAAGGMHSVCLTESGEVITFGCNDEGALGRITTEEGSEYIPSKVEIPERVIQISAGDSHSAALAESGQVYIWGNFRSGDGPMGLTADGAKQIKPVKILKDIKIIRISSGNEHIVCLSDKGIVYTCGCGETGQLGRLPERACLHGGRKGRAVLLEPSVVPVTASARRPVLIDSIFTGSYATFLRAQQSGLIYAFGLNNYNHLGYANERVIYIPKQISSFNGKSWSKISGGQHHTLALDSEGLVYALGRHDYGRLGLGENCDEKSNPTIISALENEKCTDISCGNCVSFAVSDQGSAFSWGMGTNHQLGHGNDDDCHVPRRIEGNLNSWKVIKVSGGGQHTLILACPKSNAEEKQ